MKKYRLKTEAVPFFVDKLATAICDMQTWKEYKVDEKTLEEVEEARIEYGKNMNDVCKDLSSYGEKGAQFHFTIVFPSMKFKEYNDFTKGKMIRDLMNRLQNEINVFMNGFYNNQKE